MYMGKSLAGQFWDDVNQKMVTKHTVQNLRGDDDPKWLIQNDWYIAIYFSIRLKRTTIALMLESQTIQPSLTLQYWLIERFPATWCNMFQSMRIACWDGFKEVTLECRQENIPKHYFEQIRKTIKNNHLHISLFLTLKDSYPHRYREDTAVGSNAYVVPCTVARFDPGGEWKDMRAQQWIVTPRFSAGPGAEGSHRSRADCLRRPKPWLANSSNYNKLWLVLGCEWIRVPHWPGETCPSGLWLGRLGHRLWACQQWELWEWQLCTWSGIWWWSWLEVGRPQKDHTIFSPRPPLQQFSRREESGAVLAATLCGGDPHWAVGRRCLETRSCGISPVPRIWNHLWMCGGFQYYNHDHHDHDPKCRTLCCSGWWIW